VNGQERSDLALTDASQAKTGRVHRASRQREARDNVQDRAQKHFPGNRLAGYVYALVPLVVVRTHYLAESRNKPFLLLKITRALAVPAVARDSL
jgi:hypothetical protein